QRPVPVRLHQRKQQEHQIFHVISHQLSFQATGKIIFHLSSMSGSGTHYLVHTQPPASPDLFLCRPLFLWMPLKMWLIPHVCIRPDCGKHRLTAAGLYRTVRMVLDIDRWYDIATECLECKGCKKKYPAWSEDILGQLDMGHRSQFPALLTYMTYRYSCDNRVLRMMRERTLGSSATQLYKKLMEQHSEFLGREYLYSQTGKTLTPVLQNPEEEDRLEEVDDQDLQDEGFEEEIMEDITVPVLYEDDPCRDLKNSPSSLPLPQSPASLAEPSTSTGGEQHLAPARSVLSQPSDTGSSVSDEAQGAVIGPDGIAGFQRRQKNQEMSVLAQGLTPPDPIAVADMQLPPPRENLNEAPSTSSPKHQFILLPNREGQAPLLRPGRQPAAVTRECPITPAPTASGDVQPISAPGSLLGTLVLNPDMTVSMVIPSSGASTSGAGPAPPASVSAPASAAPLSRYTQRNRRRRSLEKESGVHKRKHVQMWGSLKLKTLAIADMAMPRFACVLQMGNL
ncbi:hypothetical protein IRJ41_024093, partial [Triplophysa rosa]